MRTLEQIVHDPRVVVTTTHGAEQSVKESHDFLLREIDKRIIYGINTGFGPMASYIIGARDLIALQKNLIRSHAVGMGEPVPSEYVLGAMVVRLNVLLKGYSGVSWPLIEHLTSFVNHRIVPIVPEHGAVGTSGDLVQLAHIALALIGEGDVVYQGKRQRAIKALAAANLRPYSIQPKEGLALINGTSFMTSVAALNLAHAERLLSIATRLGAFALEIVEGFDDGITEQLHALRPHPGQREVARVMRGLLRGAKRLRSRRAFEKKLQHRDDVHTIPEDVQEIYSLRCIPQILGPVFDAYASGLRTVEIEMNAVTDNPAVDKTRGTFLHGGNFHGDCVALSVDYLKIAITKLIILSERRTNFFLNKNINRRLPPFLNLKKPGLTLALQGLQFVATSTTARSQTLGFPQYLHSISTNADNQDVVSMGADAALIAADVMQNAYIVLAIELIAAAQAVDVLHIEKKLSPAARTLYMLLRGTVPVIVEDRVMVEELPQLIETLKHSRDLDIRWLVQKE